jgi:hypothetical protein
MLPPLSAVADPYFLHACVGPQVIDVPVRPGRSVQVVPHACAQAAGAKGAADIDVEPGLEPHLAKSPDPDCGIRS